MFVQALLLFKLAGEVSERKKNARKNNKNITITIVVRLLAEHLIIKELHPSNTIKKFKMHNALIKPH